MLSLFIEKLDNGYVVKVSLNSPETFDEAPTRGRFFENPHAMADGMPTLILEAVDAAEGAEAMYRQRLAEERRHWDAQKTAAPGSHGSRGIFVGSALPPGFRGIDDANGGDYAPVEEAPGRLPEEAAALGEVADDNPGVHPVEAMRAYREDDGA